MRIFDYDKFHFIGIGGIGISAVARMMHMQGKSVTGSDGSNSEIIEDLRALGIEVSIGHHKDNIPFSTQVVIYTIAVGESNPEIIEVKQRGLTCLSYPEALGEISKGMFTIAISGTHGKTTTTAMVGHILKKLGYDPTVIVGSKIVGENSNIIAGKSKYLVVEACEYKRSFLNLNPSLLLITNIEADHLDYYKNLEDIKDAFAELKNKVLPGGKIVTESEYLQVNLGKELKLLGRHNELNAQAAVKACEKLGIKQEDSILALMDFRGTWRRLEYKGERGGNIFYDDYAHHPTEISASLSALRERYPGRRIVCVFEPHQQSRVKNLFRGFANSLSLADKVCLAPIFLAREAFDPTVSSSAITNNISSMVAVNEINSIDELKRDIRGENNACIVLMGAGDIYKWTPELLSDKF